LIVKLKFYSVTTHRFNKQIQAYLIGTHINFIFSSQKKNLNEAISYLSIHVKAAKPGVSFDDVKRWLSLVNISEFKIGF